MAKQLKDTKVGKKVISLFSKAKQGIKNIAAKASQNYGASTIPLPSKKVTETKKSSGGAKMEFRVGEGLSKEQTNKAYETLFGRKTSGGLTTSGADISNITFGSSKLPTTQTTKTSKSSGSTLKQAPAPTNALQISSASGTPSLSFSSSPSNSSTTMGLGSTAGAISSVAGINEANDLALQQKKSAEQLALDQASQAQEKNQTFLEKIFKEQQQAPTREELRQDYEKEFNIKARTAEINSLQQSLDKVMNDVANQEAVAQDRLGTNDFINNQIAQIRRNAEPVINQLSSEIKWKSGLLSDDRALMNEAIADALADSKSRIDNMKWLYSETSQYLDGKYKEALAAKIRQEERDHDDKWEIAKYAADVAMEYRKAGVNINLKPTDTWEDIQQKIQRTPLPQKSTTGGGASTQLDQAALRAYIQEYKNGNVQLANIPNKYRDAVIAGATQKAQELPNWNIFNASLKRNFELVGVDKAQYNEVKSLLAEGYTLEEIRDSNPGIFSGDIYATFSQYVK